MNVTFDFHEYLSMPVLKRFMYICVCASIVVCNFLCFSMCISHIQYAYVTFQNFPFQHFNKRTATDSFRFLGPGRCLCLLRWWNDSMMPDWRRGAGSRSVSAGVIGYRMEELETPQRGFQKNDWR